MDDLLATAENAPEKPGRSKLEPYAETITVLRRKRWSYRDIAEFLLEKAQVEVDPSTIWDFQRIRSKRARMNREQLHPRTEEAPVIPPPPRPSTEGRKVYVPRPKTNRSFDPDTLRTNDQVED